MHPAYVFHQAQTSKCKEESEVKKEDSSEQNWHSRLHSQGKVLLAFPSVEFYYSSGVLFSLLLSYINIVLDAWIF